jgi:hypothetical protein
MKHVNFFCILLFFSIAVRSQEFYEDGSMKLTEISSSKKYGYEPENKHAVKVGKISNQRAFLNALLGPGGQTVSYARTGSCCAFKSDKAILGIGLLDRYEVTYAGLEKPIILYLNGYEYETPQCPQGFTFKTADKIEMPVRYPADSIVKVTACNDQQVYAVEELLLEEKLGKHPKPENNPVYKAGEEELNKYFETHPLTDERAEKIIFRVVIGFLVDCNGKAGNFQIISKGKGLLETLANQALERVNKLPGNWEPAKTGDKAVDCYQVLTFSVRGGEFGPVSYR